MDNVHDPYRTTVLALLREAIVRLDARETAHRQRYPKTTPNFAAPRVIERRQSALAWMTTADLGVVVSWAAV
jgi:hypothetical protein